MRQSVEAAKADIHHALDRVYEGYDELAKLLDDLLRAQAHELAEKIRANCHLKPGECGCHTAADLIDPRKET